MKLAAGSKMLASGDVNFLGGGLMRVVLGMMSRSVVATVVVLQMIAFLGVPSSFAGWSSRDVGESARGGSAFFDGAGSLAVRSSGLRVWEKSDGFQFTYQALSGDGEIIALIENVTDSLPKGRAGVMMRESLGEGARHIYNSVTPKKGAAVLMRSAINGETVSKAKWGTRKTPIWVRLVREGDLFTAHRSEDGEEWKQVTKQIIKMRPDILIGLATSACSEDGQEIEAFFSNLRVAGNVSEAEGGEAVVSFKKRSLQQSYAHVDFKFSGSVARAVLSDVSSSTLSYSLVGGPEWLTLDSDGRYQGTPSAGDAGTQYFTVRASHVSGAYADLSWKVRVFYPGWGNIDIGVPSSPGGFSVTGNNVYELSSFSSKGFTRGSDGGHYVYKILKGDGAVEARVLSVACESDLAMAGVMMREDWAPASQQATLGVRGLGARRVGFFGATRERWAYLEDNFDACWRGNVVAVGTFGA